MDRILQINLPRALTGTLRGFDFRLAAELADHDISLNHIDINLMFWKFVLSRYDEQLFDALFDDELHQQRIVQAADAVARVGTWAGHALSSFGFNFGPLNASADIRQKALKPQFLLFVDEFLTELSTKVDFSTDIKLVTLCVESHESLCFSVAFATCLRNAYPMLQVVLGKHSYENFSLTFRKEDVRMSGVLSACFHHIVFHEENLGRELIQLITCETSDSGTTALTADSTDSVLSSMLRNSSYLDVVCAPLEKCPVMLPICRNKCYWKKCTFCVQIHKHLSDKYYDDRRELANAFEEIRTFQSAGLNTFLFNDEAVSPRLLNQLCDNLLTLEKPVSWNVRIIADPNFSAALALKMAQAGCSEVLFGLETVSKSTARAMLKVSQNAESAQIRRLLKMFGDANIGIFLNIIYAFPTESDDEFLETLEFAQEICESVPGVTTQLNKFSLFANTDMYRNPRRFGIKVLDKAGSENDLQINFNYVDAFGRRWDDPANTSHFVQGLGISNAQFERIVEAVGPDVITLVFALSYGSFGIIFKNRTGRNLSQALLSTMAP